MSKCETTQAVMSLLFFTLIVLLLLVLLFVDLLNVESMFIYESIYTVKVGQMNQLFRKMSANVVPPFRLVNGTHNTNVGYFGHGRFGHENFGQDISATDISAI